MIVKEIMTASPISLTGQITLREAARVLIERRIDGVPVVDEHGKLLGLVTKSHVLRSVANGSNLDVCLAEIMEKNVITTTVDADLYSLNALDVGRLPVVDQHNNLLGIVTRSDLARVYYNSTKDLERELSAVLNSVHNAIVTVDETGNVRIFNRAAEKIFGLPAEDVVGRPLTELLPSSKLADIVQTGQAAVSQKIVYNDRTLISNRTPINVDGRTVGAVAVVQDISELEHISQELQFTKNLMEELDAIIESSFDGIYVTDGDGRTIRINEAYSRITGIHADEVIGKTMQELVEEGVYDQSATVLVMERNQPVTISQEVKTGKSVLVTGNPKFDDNGRLTRVVTNVRDITELNNLRQELDLAQELKQHYQEQLSKYKVLDKYVWRSQKSLDLIDLVMRLGQVDSTVLIQGESGVGKEIIAEILHSNSLRKDKPFVRINCGAIPESLLESELFGYDAGAFTGAKKGGKMGIFEIANQGTLFLDEIGELPLLLQVKLLRVIQDKEITRVGGTKPIKVDVRLITATNRDLWEMVMKNLFRKDLFYRLNVVPVMVPPLRERREEIPVLAAHFMHLFNKRYGLNKRLDQTIMTQLLNYDWPGNVRELENVIERAIVTSPCDVIKHMCLGSAADNSGSECYETHIYAPAKLKTAMEKLEKQMIQNALNKHGTTRKAAEELGVSQPTVVRKAARYGITHQDADMGGPCDTEVNSP